MCETYFYRSWKIWLMKAGLGGKKELSCSICHKKAWLETEKTIIFPFLEENVKFFPQLLDSDREAKWIMLAFWIFLHVSTAVSGWIHDRWRQAKANSINFRLLSLPHSSE